MQVVKLPILLPEVSETVLSHTLMSANIMHCLLFFLGNSDSYNRLPLKSLGSCYNLKSCTKLNREKYLQQCALPVQAIAPTIADKTML